MQCLILAGGLGTRMRPYTTTSPKALIEVAGRPFADIQLSLLAGQGITDVVYAVGYLGQQIEEYVAGGDRWGLSVRYSYETGELQGTAGALRLALDRSMLEDCFFVLYGDSYLPIQFSDVKASFERSGQPALMTVLENQNRWDTSNAVYADGQVLRYDKRQQPDRAGMRYIDYGLSILTSAVVSELVPPARPSDLADVFRLLSEQGRLAGYPVTERFYEVGSPAGLADLELFLSNQTTPL